MRAVPILDPFTKDFVFSLPISKQWIVSITARRLYTLTSAFSLAFGVFLIAMQAVGGGSAERITESSSLVLLLRAVVLIGVVATATLWVAMWYFWFGFDDSHLLKKALWFLLLWFAFPSPALYCLMVYRRSKIFASEISQSLKGDSSPQNASCEETASTPAHEVAQSNSQ